MSNVLLVVNFILIIGLGCNDNLKDSNAITYALEMLEMCFCEQKLYEKRVLIKFHIIGEEKCIGHYRLC